MASWRIFVDSVERLKRFSSMKEFKRTYHFSQEFFLDMLDEQVSYDTRKRYEEEGSVELPLSSAYQLLLLREEQNKMQKSVEELEHLSKVLKQKLNVSLLVNLICYLFLIVMLLLSIQKIMDVIQAFRQMIV